MKRRIVLTAKLLFVAFTAMFLNWWNSYNIQPFLAESSLPIAKGLIDTPQVLPTWLGVHPLPGSIITKNTEINIILGFCIKPFAYGECHKDFVVDSDSFHATDAWWWWTRIAVNDQWVFPFSFRSSFYGTASYANVNYTFKPELPSGLHLFRIQVARSADELRNPDPDLSYEWAYRVE
jgi:hypothetical protein